MKQIWAGFCVLAFQVAGMQCAHAYLQSVPDYVGDGSLFVETESIVRTGNFATLTYVENFAQEQAYGSNTYWSKATDIRINCVSKRVFALGEGFYSRPSMRGMLLGKFPLQDEFGTAPEAGSWNFNLIKIGCDFAL